MSKTVVGLFDDFSHAQSVVNDLESAGFPRDQISIVTHEHGVSHGTSSASAGAGHGHGVVGGAIGGAAKGGVIGGLTGLAASLVMLAIPGVGPALAVGPLAATLSGAGPWRGGWRRHRWTDRAWYSEGRSRVLRRGHPTRQHACLDQHGRCSRRRSDSDLQPAQPGGHRRAQQPLYKHGLLRLQRECAALHARTDHGGAEQLRHRTHCPGGRYNDDRSDTTATTAHTGTNEVAIPLLRSSLRSASAK
jgi:hypothetical protein